MMSTKLKDEIIALTEDCLKTIGDRPIPLAFERKIKQQKNLADLSAEEMRFVISNPQRIKAIMAQTQAPQQSTPGADVVQISFFLAAAATSAIDKNTPDTVFKTNTEHCMIHLIKQPIKNKPDYLWLTLKFECNTQELFKNKTIQVRNQHGVLIEGPLNEETTTIKRRIHKDIFKEFEDSAQGEILFIDTP